MGKTPVDKLLLEYKSKSLTQEKQYYVIYNEH